MTGRNPVQGSLNFFATCIATRFGIWVVGAINFTYLASVIFFKVFTFNNVTTFQPYFTSGSHPKEFLWRFFHKVFPFYVKFSGKRNYSTSCIRVFGIVYQLHFLDFVLRIVCNNNFYRIENTKNPWGDLVEVLAHAEFQKSHINNIVTFGNSNSVGKSPNRFGCITPAS